MKALVLSGGSGTRLRPFSHSMPKQLIPIANKPVLEHVLENIRDLGVTEVGIIVGDWAPEIADVVGDGSRLGLRVTYIPQEAPLGLAHCVTLARPFLGDDDFVMYLGDNMLPEGVREVAESFRTRHPAAEVVVHRVPDPRAFGVAELGPDGTVARLVEKPREPRSDLALIGVYFFTPAIHEAVASIEPSARGELEITDAIQWLVTRGAEVRATEYRGYWKDTGQAADVLECNQTLLAALTPGILGGVDDASLLDGRVRVEPGARVTRSRIDGPAVIGAGTVIEDCHIGPDTSIGAGCVLRNTRVRDSIVMDGAEISGVPGLRYSLIGRNAVVGTGPTGDACHSLVVGDHTRIEVAA
ncbi:glucose-1-phosphate thymidylyltransferase [Streptomyces albireticuli]|uniref:Glucose-1-phosphate thymidylyltransferase n=1 Tax=Streptomyces albireticuli TaxID=1940 RepID=A0A2A2CZ20_9ACTN|nr:glucose-1-phosphate thymidylyltransferase [Streptomyces albireticuli]MCD9143654.1 glucose-1-phosphate thymidylyltransferase [Streptomyces albireticuli]MCD9161915.1 glucose-1-phosphate thymidylyltransferase [Streptomyces albireticuli]MCD9191771.1 glucose-1-phosphate thymidylyltransferase [Streptomyces albireticuli]PAU44406.1 glucose-1-phosphate thymidylyltransferase [Streptomyces albireticuli]